MRNFSGGRLDKGEIELLLDAMRWAPSAGNLQPWFFYVVINADIKRKLAHAAYEQDFVGDAACVFVICANPEESAKRYGTRGRNLYSYQDTACAVENLLLAAYALGYGACWVGAFDEEKLQAILDIPEYLRPVAIVPVGKGKVVDYTDRKPLKEVSKIIE